MIFALLAIIGLSVGLSLAIIVIYFLRYFQRYYKEAEEFQRSYNLLLALLLALILHSLYLLGKYYYESTRFIFETASILIFLAAMVSLTRQAIVLEVTKEVRKEGKVRELMEFRALEGRLGDASRELAETRNFFNSIIQSTADAIIASDDKKNITYFSHGAEEIFQVKASDVLGHNVLNLYPKEFLRRKDRVNRARELRQKGHIKNMTLRISTPSGEHKIISLSLSLLKGSDGRVKGTVGVAKDITEEQRVATEIRQLKELSDRILEGVPEGLLLLDLKFRISRVNKRFEEITGIGKEEIIGKNALEYMKIPAAERLFDAMKLKEKFSFVAYNGETIKPEEFTIYHEGRRTLTDYWAPVFDREGRVEFVLIIIRDITRRKKLEESLVKQADQLKKSNELKDIFTDIMRHDILNPIGVIKNYAELISLEKINPMVSRSIDAISRNVEKTVEMIDNASKLESITSVEEIEFEEKDLVTILEDAVETASLRASEKNMRILQETTGPCPAKVSSFIGAVFLNLLTNAVKYSPENSEIKTGIIDDGHLWKVYVKDTGEGIEDRYKETIFTRFERLQKEGVKGTGLGLAIVKRIVEIHRGRVWVEDNPGGGSIFYVELPKDLN